MIGDGPLFEDIKKLSAELELQERVLLVGSSSKVDQYLQAMDCVIATSFSEGMPLGIMEAQAAGLPCLCAEGRYPQEIQVTELVHMLPLESGPEEWAKKLIGILSGRPGDRAKWIQEHHTELLNFDQKRIAEKLLEYLR